MSWTAGVIFKTLVLVALVSGSPPLQLDPDYGDPFSLLNQERSAAARYSAPLADDFRLPEHVIPESYDISVTPVIEVPTQDGFVQWKAYGSVSIVVRAESDTTNITLNADSVIKIEKADVKLASIQADTETEIPPEQYTISTDVAKQFWIIKLVAGVAPLSGSYRITIAHYETEVSDSDTLNPPIIGLYQAKYNDTKGDTHYLATTQFETIGFRYFCPGFDEPRFKALIKLRIGRKEDFESWSYEKVETTEDGAYPADDRILPKEWKWDVYPQTPVKFPTYLLALVVANSFAREASTDNPSVGIIGPEHLINDADKTGGVFSANESAALLQEFGRITEHHYALSKMDSVAIPWQYFTFGAMENWGLNTYRDSALLYYPSYSTESNLLSIANVLSHELAHQWFGNGVTTAWWSHIWLNEGFATYFSYLGVHGTLPEYDFANQFAASTWARALQADAGIYSHPVINDATQEQIASMEVFDDMAYQKGASLIRMMEGFLGQTNLMNGIKAYLTARNQSNAFQDDLFKHLTENAEEGTLPGTKTVKTIMDTWTLQKGFPLIRVQQGGANVVLLTQERFKNNQNPQSPYSRNDPNHLWEVPVAIQDSTNVLSRFWIGQNVAVKIVERDTSKWFIANPEAYGFYRVLYDLPFARMIQAEIARPGNTISPVTKGQLIDDYFRFAREGYAQYETAFEFLNFLDVTETNHAAWYPVLNALSVLSGHWFGSSPELAQNFATYLLPKVEDALNAKENETPVIGWDQKEGEHGITVLLRARLLDWACSLESENCRQQSAAALNAWLEKPEEANPIPIDLRPIRYCWGVASGPHNVVKFLMGKYEDLAKNIEETDKASLRFDYEIDRLASALGCVQDVPNIIYVLGAVIRDDPISTDPKILSRHRFTVLTKVGMSSDLGKNHTYGVLRDNWKKFADLEGLSFISRAVSSLATYQNTVEDVTFITQIEDKIKAEDEKQYEQIELALRQAKNTVMRNVEWMSKYGNTISQWLKIHSPASKI